LGNIDMRAVESSRGRITLNRTFKKGALPQMKKKGGQSAAWEIERYGGNGKSEGNRTNGLLPDIARNRK